MKFSIFLWNSERLQMQFILQNFGLAISGKHKYWWNGRSEKNEIDEFLLKLNANNLVVISQNLNIDIKGETNKRNVLRLIQKHIAGIEGQEHLRTNFRT